jgi:DNA-binding NtrC family response regulator
MRTPLLATVLVVDDEVYVRESLAAILKRRGCEVRTASGCEEALRGDSLDGLDAVITDLKMPGRDGLDLLKSLGERAPALPVLVLTGHGTVSSAVECLKLGAADYLLKPVDPDELLLVLQRVLGQASLQREVELLRTGPAAAGPSPREDGRPLGISDAWRQVLEMAELVAPTDTAVLLVGESGTGKEEVAKYIHRKGERAGGPFVPVNCAAIPGELFESEFFGHKRGAFTGALEDRVGRFKVADRGTLLLDEIDSLPPAAQAKVLRVLQDGRFERVGDSRTSASDVRLISATNTDLSAAVENGRFRADLYYRINIMTVHLPPLRERPEDVPVLAEAFLDRARAQVGKPVRGFETETLELLRSYSWPGNVRELRNVIERGVVLESSELLAPTSLPEDLRRPSPLGSAGGKAGPGAGSGNGSSLNLRASLRAEERRLLETALARSGGVRRRAAELLGIDERNLSYYLKKHDLGKS